MQMVDVASTNIGSFGASPRAEIVLLSDNELELIVGGLNWGKIGSEALGGAIAGGIGGAAGGAVTGIMVGGIGAGPGALAGGVGGAISGGVGGGLLEIYHELSD